MGTVGAKYQCPVCGYEGLQHEPRSSENGGSYEICPSSGFQFGVSDDRDEIMDENWREAWRSRGMPWSSNGIAPPVNWDADNQVRGLISRGP
jgi:hypothetical protein